MQQRMIHASSITFRNGVERRNRVASRAMQIGHRIDETGLLLRDGASFYLRRDAGGRFTLDLRRTPVDEVEKRVRLIGTYVGPDLVDVDGVSLI